MEQYKKEQIKTLLNKMNLLEGDKLSLSLGIEDIIDHRYYSHDDVLDNIRYWVSSHNENALFTVYSLNNELNIGVKK